ncbi:EcsC family protein [Alienimonas sp. DA493]|uniref:EcsC family protein n=1 Tax=Alienimonas sp. DA493 TaxID=3373605 RepID=UPI00375447AE
MSDASESSSSSSPAELPAESLPAEALEDLENAVEVLEYRGMLRQISDALGARFERAVEFLPDIAQDKVEEVTNASLKAALNVAVKTMDKKSEAASWDLSHKLAGAAVGMVGGAFGLPSALVELPLSTTVMLRSVADIARANGEDLTKLETRLECLNVFALGGGIPEGGAEKADDGYDSAYFATRIVLAQEIGAATKSIAAKGLADDAAQPVVKFLSKIAARYGITVSEKMAAMAVPILGAAAGAAINVAFTSHFQSVARAHFSVRRLEREHGRALVEREYLRLAKKLNA